MRTYRLQRVQYLPQPIDRVFSYFSKPQNLEGITPGWLRFHIVAPAPQKIESGTLIRYRLLWHGIPISWLTIIQKWNPPFEFVDEQMRGPFRRWHHQHTFRPCDGGTEMVDEVDYALPFGFFGQLAHKWKVARDLQNIFDYRAKTIAQLFSKVELQD